MGLPDDKHLPQIATALEDTDREFWLLTRFDRGQTWLTEMQHLEGVDARRVIVTSVESFVG